jgi:hypothetical protein
MKMGKRDRTVKYSVILVTLFIGMMFTSCKGPAGPQGSKGEGGTVGPAGSNGSVMYAGKDAPTYDTGKEGDYYIDKKTGGLYGPKASSGWPENPIIVLKGEQGSKGDSGKDGSQIHADKGAPDASVGKEGDYYLDKGDYKLYGPKIDKGWGTPIDLKGAKGNANVTRYIFPGNDFNKAVHYRLTFSDVKSNEEMQESAWIVYLVISYSNGSSEYEHIPGTTRFADTYFVFHKWVSGSMALYIYLNSKTGHSYDQVEVVRIRASNVLNKSSVDSSLIPPSLKVNDYKTVANYYEFGGSKLKQ